jgi:RNA polymerase sigma factor (sigma-70 family)
MDGGETVEDDFDKLIDTYSRDIFRFVRAHTRDEAEAEDLTQEVFVRAYRHRETVFRADNIKAWLFRVAVNLCRDHARQIRRRPLVYLREVPDVAASPRAVMLLSFGILQASASHLEMTGDRTFQTMSTVSASV